MIAHGFTVNCDGLATEHRIEIFLCVLEHVGGNGQIGLGVVRHHPFMFFKCLLQWRIDCCGLTQARHIIAGW